MVCSWFRNKTINYNVYFLGRYKQTILQCAEKDGIMFWMTNGDRLLHHHPRLKNTNLCHFRDSNLGPRAQYRWRSGQLGCDCQFQHILIFNIVLLLVLLLPWKLLQPAKSWSFSFSFSWSEPLASSASSSSPCPPWPWTRTLASMTHHLSESSTAHPDTGRQNLQIKINLD